jgi:transposase
VQAFYSVRSERQLIEQLGSNLLFRWFVGLGIDDPAWDATVFTKNRERLLAGEVATLRRARHRGKARIGWALTLAAAAYNLIRLPKLLGAAA